METDGATDPLRLLVLPWQAGLRLDQLLAEAGLSRRAARRLIAEGVVRRNGERCAVQSRVVDTADVLEIGRWPRDVACSTWQPSHSVARVAVDRWVVAVAKPAGMLSQPASRRRDGELACDEQLLLELAAELGRRPYLRLVHRIDRQTSGLLLFSRRPDATTRLASSWRRGEVERQYLAVVGGEWPEELRRIEAPVARDRTATWRFRVAVDGATSTTEVEVVQRAADWTLLRCRLHSGRTHQVRVHLAHCGHPVRGDRLYGGDEAPRPLLHAWSLRLPHPSGRGILDLTAPSPPDLAAYMPASRDGGGGLR